MSTPKPCKRPTKLSTSGSREEKAALVCALNDEREKRENAFSSLEDLESKLQERNLPAGMKRIIQVGQHLYVDIPNEGEPVVKCCVKIKESLEVEIWCKCWEYNNFA